MQCAIDAESIIRTVRIINSNGDGVEGIQYDDPDLEVRYKLQASGSWVSPALVEGTLGTYLANSWVEDSRGNGLYQWCPPNAVVVAGTVTDIEMLYGANPRQYDTIEAVLVPISSMTQEVGPGDDEVTITIEDDGVPQENVNVWISSDSSGSNVIAGTLTTNGSGQVVFLLTDGATYYLWAHKAGKVDIRGQEFVAVAD